jgi:hypothetical protein
LAIDIYKILPPEAGIVAGLGKYRESMDNIYIYIYNKNGVKTLVRRDMGQRWN